MLSAGYTKPLDRSARSFPRPESRSPMLSAVRRRIRHLTAAFSTSRAADATVSYLISACYLSPAAAARAADTIHLASPGFTTQGNAVLDLLRRYGFSEAHISATVRKFPKILVSDAAKTLQPKLDFLASVGITAPLLPKLISLNPALLHRSIQGHLAPLFESLREVLGSDARVLTAIRQMPFVLRCAPKTTLSLALPALRDVHGLSPEDVSKLVAFHPGVILLVPERVDEIVRAVKSTTGVQPGHPKFVCIFAILSKMKTPIIESKIALYQSLGFEKDIVTAMLRRYPLSLAISKEKIIENVEFLVIKAGLSLEDIVSYPSLLTHSIETHSKKCAVLTLLRREGEPEGHHRVAVVLKATAKRFLEVYVRRHQDKIPDVALAMDGKIPFKGFNVLKKPEEEPLMSSASVR
ncbi:hypothetical protein BRADI_2g25372v3 [Brachypodium distachyon]|uniref:Uncharacterized protein n=3 Tax=Brachypodium distachyon TaxID=15368 RepID=A0A0Q3IKC5_BRADI|nr:hypothetical protein BRADI_2g25372v3 [Brachypodium distachyon]